MKYITTNFLTTLFEIQYHYTNIYELCLTHNNI